MLKTKSEADATTTHTTPTTQNTIPALISHENESGYVGLCGNGAVLGDKFLSKLLSQN